MSVDSVDRIGDLARTLARREKGRVPGRAAARSLAERLQSLARDAVGRFAVVAAGEGAPHLDLVTVSDVEPDDKSIRAFQVRLTRGRHEAVIVSKDRGEVMLVGPYRKGDTQGPCRPRSEDSDGPDPEALRAAVEDLVADLIEQAFE